MAINIESILSETTRTSMQSMAGSMTEVNVVIREQNALVGELESNLRSVEIAYRQMNVEARSQETTVETFQMLRAEIGDVKKELEDLTKGSKEAAEAGKEFDGFKNTISTLSGAMDVAINTAALFGVEQEKLTRIQEKLQNLMGIVNGLQQVINAVNTQGAASTSILAGAQNLLSGATARLTVALGGSAIAAKALMASLTLGLSVAITAVIAIWNRYNEKQEQVRLAKEKAAESAQMQAKAEDEQRDAAANSVASQLLEYKKLQTAYQALGDDLQKKRKFVDDNQDAFSKLGIAVSDVTDAENLLVKGEGAFLQTVANRALIAASMEIAATKYKEAIKVMLEADAVAITDADRVDAKRHADKAIQSDIRKGNRGQLPYALYQNATTDKGKISGDGEVIALRKKHQEYQDRYLKDLLSNSREAVKAYAKIYVEDATNVLGTVNGLQDMNKEILGASGIKTKEEQTGGNRNKRAEKDDTKEHFGKIATAQFNAIAKMQEQVLEIKQDGYDKERAQAELNYQKELQEIESHQKEVREAYGKIAEKARKTGKPIDPEVEKQYKESELNTAKQKENVKVIRDQNITAIYAKEAKENEEAFKTLIAPYRDYKMQMADLQKGFAEAKNKLEESRSTVRLKKVKDELEGLYAGELNADDKRWASQENGNIPLQQFTVQRRVNKDSDEMEFVEILVTPVTKDGQVLSQDKLQKYIDEEFKGKIDFTDADSKGILVATNVDIAGVDLAAIQSKQREYHDLQTNKAANDSRDQQVDTAIGQLEIQKNEAGDELALVFAQKDAYFQTFMDGLVEMSLKQLEDALLNAETALAVMESKGDTNARDLAVARAQVATLRAKVNTGRAEKETEDGDKNKKWDKTASSIKKCKAELDNMIGSMDGLDESTKAALQTASNIAGGTIGMIDSIKLLGKGAAEEVKGLEKASVILAIIGAAVQIMTAIFSLSSGAEKRHQQALAEIAESKLAMQREYNLLLLQQSLLMKEATSIFGEQQILKAVRAIEVYNAALSDYKETMRGEAPTLKLNPFDMKGSLNAYSQQLAAYEKGIGALNNITVKTGHKKTGLFGWGKGKDIYTDVLSLYPDLIEGENRLNIERAKTIINTHSMSDQNKALLQNLIDLQDQADEAQESLRSYLQDTFGSLGDGIMESITSAIMNDGVDAWELFGEKGAEVLQNLGKQLTYSLFFAERFTQLQKKLEAVYGSGKTEKEIAKDAMDLIGSFYNEIGSQMDAAQSFMETWQSEAEKHNFDLWKSEESGQSGQAGSFTTMSQDQGTKLEGLFTSLQDHASSIDYTVVDISRAMYAASDKLSEIARNTAYCVHLEQMAGDIAELKRDGIKMK